MLKDSVCLANSEGLAYVLVLSNLMKSRRIEIDLQDLEDVLPIGKIMRAAAKAETMSGAVFMRGERVTLNTVHPDDYGFLQELFNDPSICHQAGVSLPLTEAAVADFVEETEDTVQFLICQDDTPIGHVVLTELDTQARTGELGWVVLHPDEQGDGYATEAVDLCLRHAFDDRGQSTLRVNLWTSTGMDFFRLNDKRPLFSTLIPIDR